MLVRLVLFAAITSGFAVGAAEQQPVNTNRPSPTIGKTVPDTLPTPLSSAIQRMVTGYGLQQKSVKPPSFAAQALDLARVEEPVKQCSIPLAEYKISTERQFFIRELPVPRDARRTDGMPIFRASVCGK
ncbi:MAG: hypothetical protein WB992_16855 [Bryobacteraceae bacterium]